MAGTNPLPARGPPASNPQRSQPHTTCNNTWPLLRPTALCTSLYTPPHTKQQHTHTHTTASARPHTNTHSTPVTLSAAVSAAHPYCPTPSCRRSSQHSSKKFRLSAVLPASLPCWHPSQPACASHVPKTRASSPAGGRAAAAQCVCVCGVRCGHQHDR